MTHQKFIKYGLACQTLIDEIIQKIEEMSIQENEMVHQFTADNIFRKYALNSSEKLGEIEVSTLLKDALKQMGSKENVSSQRVKLFISRIDKDGDWKISKKEMVNALKENSLK